ncbi:MAG: GntP family permease [Peptococcaceae bacterium]|nr:GntP family permease [Peptococcaceae bacterium]
MDVLGIFVSLALLIFFAYRGYSVILFAPVCALVAVLFNGAALLPSYTEIFMVNAATYFKNFFAIFMLGAVFGKVMEDSGAAASIAHAIIKRLGPKRAILSSVLACMVLTYGGVSMFVVVFAIYPFARALFKEADIPKHLIPGVIGLGAFACTMDAIPGSPQIQNMIPTRFFGTTLYSAPVTGLIGAVIMFVVYYAYLEWQAKKAKAKGEGYGHHTVNETDIPADLKLPNPVISSIPLFTVLVLNYVFTKWIATWDPNLFKAYGITINTVQSTWALLAALVIGIVISCATNYKNLKGNVVKSLNAGTLGSLLAIVNTASEVGYGNTVASLVGFKAFSAAMLNMQGGPLLSEAVTVNTLAAITGSASGGMSIALGIAAQKYLEWGAQVGITPELLHRIASMASGGMDTLPHNGAIITLLAVCGLTHRQSYKHIGVLTIVKTVTAFLMVALHSIIFFNL